MTLECDSLFHKEITCVMLVYVCFELSVCMFWLLVNLQFVLILSVENQTYLAVMGKS